MNNRPDFSVTQDEITMIHRIALRAYEINNDINFTTLMMDLSATHKSCPLDLQKLLDASTHDFVHDVGGIMRHINRRTGHLENCFLPRFAIIKE